MKKLLLPLIVVSLMFIGCPSETEVDHVTITPETASIGISETQQFTARAYDADNNEISDVDFTWTSSNTAIATVSSSGLATGIASGNCLIIAEAGDVADTATLTITSGPTHHKGAITADETWYASENPHIIDGDVWVENNATLTIRPGCIVRFETGKELYAGFSSTAGAIIANGTPDSIILFTSNVTNPSPGDWYNVGLYDNTMNTSSFSYCTFEYGGGSSGYPGELHAEGINFVKISNCTFRNSGNYGVYLTSDAGFNTFTNNTITSCAQYPLHINAEYVRTIGSGNTLTGNTIDAVEVTGGTIHTSGTWVNPGVPYVIVADVEIGDNATNPVITIAPGNTIKFQPDVEFYAGFTASGGLIADGTSSRITFTSNVASPSPGDWYNIGFYDYAIDASSRLINCTIEYGGGSTGYPGLIYIENAIPTITGDSLKHSDNWGIYLEGTIYPNPNDLLNNNTFYYCPAGNVRVP
ncbi:MAG: Ig-like domain-containing protein [bacterium]